MALNHVSAKDIIGNSSSSLHIMDDIRTVLFTLSEQRDVTSGEETIRSSCSKKIRAEAMK